MPIPPKQRIAVEFLTGLAGQAPIETHISAVFVGRPTVWKMKKAVALPYLDFRLLATRRHYLERELALNKPPAPDLYRDVVAIVRDSSGRLALDQGRTLAGEPIEWVLRMARVPPADFFDRIAAEGRLTPELARALGRAIAAYHQSLAPLSGIDHGKSLERLVAETQRSALAAGLPEPEILDWQEKVQHALAGRADWLAARAAAGFVRRAHGDLHLRNLCLWHGRPVPFDALEFDERLATIDLGFDLAFLLMDLDVFPSPSGKGASFLPSPSGRGVGGEGLFLPLGEDSPNPPLPLGEGRGEGLHPGRAAANLVLSSYIAATGDTALVGGLVPYLSLRAITRAHVEAAGGHDAEARAYLDAAMAYLAPASPALIAVGGLPGTGKSTLARALAPALGPGPGALVVSSDIIRKRRSGVSPETRLPPAAYTQAAGRLVATDLLETARLALDLGHAVILDATFLDPGLRKRTERTAAAAGVPFLGLWLEAPLGVLEQRVEARSRQAVPDPSDATVAVLRRFAHSTTAPGPAWRHVSATTADAALAAAACLARHCLSPSLAKEAPPCAPC